MRGDRHSSRIEQNKVGLLHGAALKKAHGEIDEATEREIAIVVARAQARDFRPLLYIVPYGLVEQLVRPIPVEKKAHPLSDEYVVEALPRDSFDVLELPL